MKEPCEQLKRNGLQYDRDGKRVRVNGKLTKPGEYYTHHDTCSCKPRPWNMRTKRIPLHKARYRRLSKFNKFRYWCGMLPLAIFGLLMAILAGVVCVPVRILVGKKTYAALNTKKFVDKEES